MNEQTLNQLSYRLCMETNERLRGEAEETFNQLVGSNNCVETCCFLLEHGQSPYNVMVASNALKRSILRSVKMAAYERLQLSQFLLKYICEHYSLLERYALNSICKVFALIIKMGWLEVDYSNDSLPFQKPVEQLLQAGTEQNNNGWLALKMLTIIVEEMRSDEGMGSISELRRASCDMRDKFLCDIFILAVKVTKEASSGDEETLKRIRQALDLIFACVDYDFTGTVVDESVDEIVCTQLPSNWKAMLLQHEVVKLMFDLYYAMPIEAASIIFQILIHLASVRRTYFDITQRQQYLNSMIDGIVSVLQNSDKLSESDAFHNFCRFISKMKMNNHLTECCKSPNFYISLEMINAFTEKSFKCEEFMTSPGIYYLMSFWNRLAGSLSYARTDEEVMAAYIPKITQLFINSRMELADATVKMNADDLLDDETNLHQLMDLFTGISRRNYLESAQALMELFDKNVNILVNNAAANDEEKTCVYKRVVWIVRMMAVVIGGKPSNFVEGLEERMDGELAGRAFQLMYHSDIELNKRGIVSSFSSIEVQLELAYLFLMERFRKCYVTETSRRDLSIVYSVISSRIGVSDEKGMLKMYAEKFFTNLKCWSRNVKLLNATISLLNEISIGFINVHRLLMADGLQLLVQNHDKFEFVASCADVKVMKIRKLYYAALLRLISTEMEQDSEFFMPFMKPITDKFKYLHTIFQNRDFGNESPDTIRLQTIGLCRDMCGIVTACLNKSLYSMVLNWMFSENLFETLSAAIQWWNADAEVTMPVLKLLADLSTNRQGRLSMEPHTCTSVMLFREISRIICEYGNYFLTLPDLSTNRDLFYKQRVKNMRVIFSIVRMVLIGQYLPYGVLWIYKDPSLDNLLNLLCKLLLRVFSQNLFAYTKFAHEIFTCMTVVVRHNMPYVSRMDEETFLTLLKCIHYGVNSIDTVVISEATITLDILLDFLFERIGPSASTRPRSITQEPESNNCIVTLEKHPNVLPEIMISILNQLMYDDARCHWSMSRPLLGLMIAYEAHFETWKNDFIARQPVRLKDFYLRAFPKLIADKNTAMKNKDVFTNNLTNLKRDLNEILKHINAGEENVMLE